MHIEHNSQMEEKIKRLSGNMKEKQIDTFRVSRQCKTFILIKFTCTKISLLSLGMSFNP